MSCTLEQRREAFVLAYADIALQESLGMDVTDARATVELLEKNFDNEVKQKNILKRHEKQFDSVDSNRINEINGQSPRVGKSPVYVYSGETDKNGNTVYEYSYGRGPSKGKQYTVSDGRLDLDQDRAYGSMGKDVPKNKKHVELVNDMWENPKEAKKLFNDLASMNPDEQYNKKMASLLESIMDSTTPILNKFRMYIDETADKNEGVAQVSEKGSKVILNINKKSETVRGDMSAVEVYMHEMLHMSVETARQFKKGPLVGVINQLNVLHKQARKAITVEDLTIDGNTKRAQALWDQLFDGDHALSEFIALGMTNPKVMELLGNMEAEGAKHEKKSDSIWDTMSHVVIQMYEFIRDLVNATKAGTEADERLQWLVSELWDHNSTSAETNSISKQINEGAGKVRDKLDRGLVKSVIAAGAILGTGFTWLKGKNKDNVVGDVLGVAGNTASLFSLNASDKEVQVRSRWFNELSAKMDGEDDWLGLGGIFASEGTIMSTIKYVGKDDKLTTQVERFGLMNNKIDSERTDTIVAVGEVVKNELAEDISEEEQVALSRGVIETDMQSILREYRIEDVRSMLEDEKKIDEAIEAERKALDGFIDDEGQRNYYKSQTMGLGHFLATGESGSSVHKTAIDIINEFNPKLSQEDKTSATQIIDRLATLEALKRTEDSVKKSVLKTSNEGIEALAGIHKMYMAKAAFFASKKKNREYPRKGEIKDTAEVGLVSRVASGDKATEERMNEQGYQKKGETAVKGLHLYTSVIKGMPSYEKQAMAKINDQKRLHTLANISQVSYYSQREVLPKESWEYDSEEDYEKAKIELNEREAEKAKLNEETQKELVYSIIEDAKAETKAQMKSIKMPVIDGYDALATGDSKLPGYAVSIGKEVYAGNMRQDNKAPSLMGKMVAEIAEKEAADKLNKMVMKTILKDMENYERGEKDYIEIGPDAKVDGSTGKAFSESLWKGAPQSVREQIYSRPNGSKYIAVRRDLARMYFGAKAPSLLQMKLPFTKGTTPEDLIRKLPKGAAVVNVLEVAGALWEEVVSIQKVDIVLKTPAVLINNIVSNIYYSIALHQMPWEVMDGQIKMFGETKRYMENKHEIDRLTVQMQSGVVKGDKLKELKIRIRELNRVMKDSAVAPLMEEGLFTSIVENIDDKDLVGKSKLKSLADSNEMAKGLIDGTPKIVKDGINTLYITQDTGMFKALQMATQYSDFVARANRYHFLINKKGVNPKVAMKMILDEFVNYNRIDSDFIRWVNKMGFAWFTKYFFGANKSMLAKLRNTPTSMVAMSLLLDEPNPSDASPLEKDFAYSVNGPFDTMWDGTFDHIVPPSAVEIFMGVID